MPAYRLFILVGKMPACRLISLVGEIPAYRLNNLVVKMSLIAGSGYSLITFERFRLADRLIITNATISHAKKCFNVWFSSLIYERK